MQTSCNTHKQNTTVPNNESVSEIFFEPEQQAYYLHGGSEGLLNDLYTTLLKTALVTQECVSGRVAVRFVISEDGQIDSNTIKVIKNWAVPEDYIDAVILAIKSLGKFEPGKMNGTPKRVAMTLVVLYPIPVDIIKTNE